MFNKRNTECIIKTHGYHNYDTILPHNYTRGIWLLWNTGNVEVIAISKETRAIHCIVYEKSTTKQCVLIIV